MPRLRQVPRAESPGGIVDVAYDLLFDDRDPVAEPGTSTGTPGDWWTVFALVPDILKHSMDGFRLYQQSHTYLDPILRELGQTRAGFARGSQFVFSQHSKSCRALGIDDAKIDAIRHWSVSDLFSPIERAVLAYTDALVLEGGRVPDEVFTALKAELSDEQILGLTYIVCMYEMHATMSRALRTEFDDRPEPIVEVPAPGADNIGFDIGSITSEPSAK